MERFPYNVLVVDDSPSVLGVITSTLQAVGVRQVKGLTSAKQALDEVEVRPDHFDAVFTDLHMPEMDGMEFIRELSDRQYKGAVTIVSEMADRIIELAAEIAIKKRTHLIGHISKPIQEVEINQILHKLNEFNHKRPVKLEPLTEAQICEAIKDERLIPYYQPKIEAQTQQVVSLEILTRIKEPGSSHFFMPEQFIPVAEKHDLIDFMTHSILRRASDDFGEMQRVFGEHIKLALNMSPIQLDDLQCPDHLEMILSSKQLQPKDLIIEITEQQALRSLEQLETLNRLGMRGFEISLDDFGTGFTNVKQLRTLPFNEIKIDRSFIRDISEDVFSQTIVKSLVEISAKNELTLVAEGVENIEEFNYLSRLSPTLLIQGYLVSKPKACQDIIRWFNSWQKNMLK